MFVQFNQCDCFIPNLFVTDIIMLMQFLFYSVMVSKSMSNDTSIIRAFSVACVDHKLGVQNDIHFLVLENSNKLVSHAASDPASSIFVSTMVDNLSSFKAWKLFDDKTEQQEEYFGEINNLRAAIEIIINNKDKIPRELMKQINEALYANHAKKPMKVTKNRLVRCAPL